MKAAVTFFLSFLLFAQTIQAQTHYLPSDAGSKVHFTIKNFGISTGGDFKGLKGAIHFDPSNPASADFSVTVDAATVNTDNSTRDNHLRKEEYFDVAKHPTLNFKSIKITAAANGMYSVSGNLTIKGITKPVQFLFTAVNKTGGTLFEGSFEINRRDFKVGGNSFVLGDKVKVQLSIFAAKAG